MSEHAKFSPSSLGRTKSCPGSHQLSIGQPNISSPAAERGTMLHTQAELAIEGRPFSEVLSEEDLSLIQPYIDYCLALKKISDIAETERQVQILGEKCWGTIDFLAITGPRLTIVDLKTGIMSGDFLIQLMAYALGALKEFNFVGIESVHLVIIQPAVSPEPQIHRTTPDELWRFEKELKQIIEMAEDKNPQFRTGAHCRWCNASSICVAAFDEATEMATRDVAKMSLESVGVAYAKTKFIKGWVKSVEDRTKFDLMSGVEVPGFKLVAGNRARSWSDPDIEAKLEEVFDEKSYEKRYLSVPQAEKLLGGKTLFADSELFKLVEVAEGYPTIVKDDDKRQALVLDVFKDETEKGKEDVIEES